MFGKRYTRDLIVRSTDNETDRRVFLKGAAAAGLGTLGAATLGGLPAAAEQTDSGPSDAAILNFALNLEYLEGEFYHHAAYGSGLPSSLTDGRGGRGRVEGGRKVSFKTPLVRNLAEEIAGDERAHVKFIRGALGNSKVGLPKINIYASFTAAARAAGLVGPHQTFDPYANENNFLLAAFLFEDVGVTAYKGAAPLINNSTYLAAAAGILAVEAYHAAAIRTLLLDRGLGAQAHKLSNARDALDGPKRDDDRGPLNYRGNFKLVPSNQEGIAFARTPGEVLNIVYLTPKSARKGGFFPDGVNGSLNASASH